MIIYTDGSCLANGKTNSKGGFGVVILDDSENLIDTYAEFEENTTNNRQEMKAIIWAIKHYGHNNLKIYSDSAYAVNTFSNWMYSWVRNNWKKSDNQTPENLDLVQEYYNLIMEENCYADLFIIKGHNGNKWNEMADQLATGKIKGDLNE